MQFLITLSPCRESLPEDATADEQARVGEHFHYLQAQLSEGRLILAGRTQERPYRGLAIIEVADRGSAEEFLAKDPAIVAGVFTGDVQEYQIALMRCLDT
jgi:uncharacterized protein YciI